MSSSIRDLTDEQLEEKRVRLERTIIGSSLALDEVIEEKARRRARSGRMENDSAAPKGAAGPQ